MALHVSPSVFDCAIVLNTITNAAAKELARAVRKCASKRILRSKWVELSAKVIGEKASVAVWDTFVVLTQTLTNQYGDWLDVGTLGILILLQVYKPRRHRIASEVWQDMSALVSPRESPRVLKQSPRDAVSHQTANLAGNDDSEKVAFIEENMLSFVELVCDDVNDVKADIIPHLAFLFSQPDREGTLEQIFKSGRPHYDIEYVAQRIRDQIDSSCYEDLLLVEQVTKTWILLPSDAEGSSAQQLYTPRKIVKVIRCDRAYVYITDPVKIVTISYCSNCQIVIAGCSMLVLKNCSKMKVHVNAQSILISNSIDIVTHACVRNSPVVIGDSRGLTFGPCNIISSRVDFCLRQLNIQPSSKDCMVSWSQPTVMVPSSSSAVPTRTYTLVKPEDFCVLRVPEFEFGLPVNALILPEIYRNAWSEQVKRVSEVQKTAIKCLQAEAKDGSSPEDTHLHAGQLFRNWLVATGNMRQIDELRVVEEMMGINKKPKPT
eukprot:GEMP01020310.1.p1 GENE.GEMP01020310.1~~GEMP01020310.1.p1  ORF type:complete len:516 (+),score=87.74 GEMP01020310.1:81-1550(+)